MMRPKGRDKMSLTYRQTLTEPNHRQQVAVDKIEFAIGELATVLLSNCRVGGLTGAAITNIRKAIAPVLAEILTDG
jgi:hypothetical protein